MMRTLTVICGLILAGQLIGQGISVNSIIGQVDSVYATAFTYKDSGHVYSSFNKEGKIDHFNSFKTTFKRAVFLRFTYNDNGDSFSYRAFQWDSTGTIHGYSWLKSWIKKDGDLGSEVAAATGVSAGAAHTIPRMLMPDVLTGWHILRKNPPDTLLGTEVIDGQNCYVVGRKGRGGGPLARFEKIWIDQDSFLIRRIGDPSLGNYTVYYPSMNQPLPADAEVLPFKSDVRKVFWKNVFLEWSPVFALILFLAFQGIGLLLKRRSNKSTRGYLEFVFLNPGSKKVFNFMMLAYMFLPRAIMDGIIPSLYLVLLLFMIPMSLLILMWQYSIMPNWFFRQKEFYFDIITLILSLGTALLLLNTNETDTIKLGPDWIFLLIFLTVTVIGIRYYRRSRVKNELLNQTHYDGERERSIWTEASLFGTRSVLLSNWKGGRLLLFHDHLVFVPKLGTPVSIPFRTIRNIKVIREWLILPVGLQITDYQNQSRYLAVHFPYYWKSRIRRS